MQEEQLHKQEESVTRQESERRRTIDYEAELRHKNEVCDLEFQRLVRPTAESLVIVRLYSLLIHSQMARLDAELQGKARVERQNIDIRLQRIRAKAEEQRKTVLEGIRTAGAVLGSGFQASVISTS